MIVYTQIPALPDKSDKFKNFWLDTHFGTKPSANDVDNAWAFMFVRRVDAAMTEYSLGAEQVDACWNNHAGMGILENNRAVCHFETCINNTHAARSCFERLRGSNTVPAKPHAALAALSPTFLLYTQTNDPLRLVRNGIQHGDEWVLEGKIDMTQNHTLRADGIEQPHPGDVGQTIKNIDRLLLGNHTILFADLAMWLIEMADAVDVIR